MLVRSFDLRSAFTDIAYPDNTCVTLIGLECSRDQYAKRSVALSSKIYLSETLYIDLNISLLLLLAHGLIR